MTFETRNIPATSDAIAPDGSEVRLLGSLPRGSMAAFRLAPFAVSKAVTHRTVEEIWYFTAGYGRMWRKLGDREEITEVAPKSDHDPEGYAIPIPLRLRGGARSGRGHDAALAGCRRGLSRYGNMGADGLSEGARFRHRRTGGEGLQSGDDRGQG